MIELVYSLLLFAVVFWGASGIMELFAENGDAQVVRLGTDYLRLIAFMYLLPGITNAYRDFSGA